MSTITSLSGAGDRRQPLPTRNDEHRVRWRHSRPVSGYPRRAHLLVLTGKSGTNRATGLPVREMATEDDCRLWITLGGTAVWED